MMISLFAGKAVSLPTQNKHTMDYAIIAAGEGSRLVQEGMKTPKPLLRLHGVPLIDRLIHLFLRHHATSISIIVNKEMTEVQAHLKALSLPVPFHLLVQSTPSSMHSFHALSRFLTGDRFCLTTVDTIFQEDEFTQYIRTFEQTSTLDGLMAVTSFVDDEKPLYVKTDDDYMIQAFLDATDEPCRYVSGGIYCLRNTVLPALDQAMEQGISRMRNYQRLLVSEGLHLKAYPFHKIIDIDHISDLAKAETFLA